MLLKYESYINEALTPEEIEKRKKQAMATHMRVYLSKDLAEILKTIDHPIAQDLLTLSRKNVKFDISFLDIPREDKKNNVGKITYIPTKVVKKLEDQGLDVKKARNNYNSEIWTSNSRQQPSNIGKVVKKLFKDKYSPGEIEKFSNLFKGKMEEKSDKLRLVYGDDIKKYYLEKHYAEMRYTLGGSCMRYPRTNDFLQIYAENTPDNGAYSHVGMLVLFDDYDKVLGRALVWFNSIKPYYKEEGGKIINIPRVFMDRIYATSDHYFEIFLDHARKNNWLYKQKQSYDNNNFIDPEDGNVHSLTLSFRLKPKKYDLYPYMDTLHYYTPETGRIASEKPKKPALKKYDTYYFRSTDGSGQRIRE